MEKDERNKNTENMTYEFTMSDIGNDESEPVGDTVKDTANDSTKASKKNSEKRSGSSGRTFREVMMQRVMIPTFVLILALLIGIPSLLYSTVHGIKEITGGGKPQFEQGRNFKGPGENGGRSDSRGGAPGGSDNTTSDGAVDSEKTPNNSDNSTENNDSINNNNSSDNSSNTSKTLREI